MQDVAAVNRFNSIFTLPKRGFECEYVNNHRHIYLIIVGCYLVLGPCATMSVPWTQGEDRGTRLQIVADSVGGWQVVLVFSFALALAYWVSRIPELRHFLRLDLVVLAAMLATLIDNEFFRALGMIVSMCIAIAALHYQFFVAGRSYAVLLGIVSALFAYTCAAAGVIASHPEMPFWELFSTAIYEASQVLLLNMSAHDEQTLPASAKFYFSMARLCAAIFTLFLAYETVLFISRRARTRILLFLDRFRNSRNQPLRLVVGLGTVGTQLSKNLAVEGGRVIAIEANPDNPCWELPPVNDLRLLKKDATRGEVLTDLPFDGVDTIYVTAGDDQRNLEIAQLVQDYAKANYHKALKYNALSSDHFWSFHRRFAALKKWLIRDVSATCHVQIYDPNMRRIVDQKLYQRLQSGNAQDHEVEVRPFNALELAVRHFVQFELSHEHRRPRDEKEVALFVIVGFDDIGQEMALGLGHLAHFENLHRSRLLVLSESDNQVEEFCSRYPRFSRSQTICDIPDLNGFDEWADRWDPNPTMELEAARAECGCDFATNTQFARRPLRASDDRLMKKIRQLTQGTSDLKIKPVVIVCDKDWQRCFAWASEFAEGWKQYCLREKLKPHAEYGREHPPLPTYFWLQGHQPIRELLAGSQELFPFGIAEGFLTHALIDGTTISTLAATVQQSYDFAVHETRKSVKKLAYSDIQSNLQAAAHALIKYRIVGGRTKELESGLTLRHMPSISATNTFFFRKKTYRLDAGVEPDANIVRLAQIEHNRWMAEQLLASRQWIATEPRKHRPDKKRRAEELHMRDTLCAWRYLTDAERNKDIAQAFFTLKHLSQILPTS